MAVAQAIEVLPTPPLPVKNRKRGGCCRNFMGFIAIRAGTAARVQQQRLPEQQLPAGATSAKAGALRQARPAQRVSSARFG